jgi:alpha-glucosidase
MDGKYYFGALFGDLDYYILLGDEPADVVGQYTRLTGRSAMPPKYVFGFHQGCYGYYDRERLETVARAYREARIPIDGLHIDIDLQDNYRVFTHSEMKFPRAAEMIAALRKNGFKCSTVVTPLLTNNPLDETTHAQDGSRVATCSSAPSPMAPTAARTPIPIRRWSPTATA